MKFITYSFKSEKQTNKQLVIDELLKKDKPYRNALCQLLPWEEPEYLKTLKQKLI